MLASEQPLTRCQSSWLATSSSSALLNQTQVIALGDHRKRLLDRPTQIERCAPGLAGDRQKRAGRGSGSLDPAVRRLSFAPYTHTMRLYWVSQIAFLCLSWMGFPDRPRVLFLILGWASIFRPMSCHADEEQYRKKKAKIGRLAG